MRTNANARNAMGEETDDVTTRDDVRAIGFRVRRREDYGGAPNQGAPRDGGGARRRHGLRSRLAVLADGEEEH